VGERVEVVLDAQQLKRIPAVAIHKLALEILERGDLGGDISGIDDDRPQDNDQAEEQARRRRTLWRPSHTVRIQRRVRGGKPLSGRGAGLQYGGPYTIVDGRMNPKETRR
jgi:hypothetical protein